MAKLVPFSQKEAVLLLDAYLNGVDTNQPRSQTVKRVSEDLRKMAVNSGMKIDDAYRSVSGIHYQITSMESAYTGKTISAPATKLFAETVAMFRENRSKYDRILEEARSVIDGKMKIDFRHITSLAYTRPTSLVYLGEEQPGISNWTQLYVRVLSCLLEKYPDEFRKMLNSNITNGQRIDFGTSETSKTMTAPKKVNDGLYAETNLSATDIVTKIRILLEKCNADYDDLEISYEKKLPQAEAPLSHTDATENSATTRTGRNDPVIEYLKIKKLEFFDLRDKSGCLWIVGNAATKDLLRPLIEAGVALHFKESGGNATNGRSAWWTKADTTQICLIANSSERMASDVKPVSHQPWATSSNNITMFRDWLILNQKMAEKSARSYTSAITNCEQLASRLLMPESKLYGVDYTTAQRVTNQLAQSVEYREINASQHNRYRAAIAKYLLYLQSSDAVEYIVPTERAGVSSFAEPTKNEDIQKVLREHYTYGFKFNSIREMMRFRQFADAMDVQLPENDEQLKTEILACGTVIDGKLFCKSDNLPQELRDIVEEIFSNGTEVIYYESLLAAKSEWMSSHIITSEEMLKEYLQKSVSGCAFAKKFMVKGQRCSEKEAVTSEIRRVWGDRPTESLDTLSDRLPYIPSGNIGRVISGNDIFVNTNEGEYFFIDRLAISEDEAEDILEYVEDACEETGFASLSDIPIADLAEENYEISQIPLWNAIYKKILAGKYHLNGKILTKDRPELDAVSLVKRYLKGKDECSFDEAAEKIVELTGSTNRSYAFQALYDEMVRVDKNRFVATRHVHFDVNQIDDILARFITDDFRAVRDVTTFAMFPVCGQSWNHYLLESYCYKYSKKYSLHVLHFNDKNAGIIAKRDYDKSYFEMLAIALSRMDIELTESAAGKALFDAGYMGKSKYSRLGEIVQRAEAIREER